MKHRIHTVLLIFLELFSSMSDIVKHIDYPQATMFDLVERIAGIYPDDVCLDFFGNGTTYSQFVERILKVSRAFTRHGIREGDCITICMPNCPQALECFYGLDHIGVTAAMIHPQSSQEEISIYLNKAKSKMILVPDMFCEKVEKALESVDHRCEILVTRIQEELPVHLKVLYLLKVGHKYLKFPRGNNELSWKSFLAEGEGAEIPLVPYDENRTSVILFSGGTTGKPKGICLTDFNINSCALEAREAIEVEFKRGLKMLSCMPIFHGFGLALNIHIVLIHGACCLLMPNFNIKSYSDMVLKKHPSFIVGVPAIFDAFLKIPNMDNVDLSFLEGMFCGGDSLTVEQKKKIDRFLLDHNAHIMVREGYGLTECVTASCLTPKDTYKEGSIGLPFPDMTYAIVKPGTDDVLPYGEEGEIILRGPSVMKGYLNDPEETAHTLKRLKDGNTWLYTGDLGMMDPDGYVYFRQRIKRMIITNGYNVYPGNLENALDQCPEVDYSCIIGVKDQRRGQRVRAYVVLNKGYESTDKTRSSIIEQLKLKVSAYALPREIIFRDELPRTLVGKVAYRLLEEEAMEESNE